MCALALQAALIRAQDRPLLSNVAWTYAQLIDYRVEVETKIRDLASDEPATKRRFVLAASRPKMWYVHELVLAPFRAEVLLGSDGEIAWALAPSLKRYVIHDPPFERTEEWLSLRDIHSRYLLRFELIDRVRATTELLGYRTHSDGRRKTRCAVLRLQPDKEDWTEEIWIDSQRSIVLKSVFRKTTPFGVVLTETEWRNLQPNAGHKPLFTLVAPRDAMRTSAISIP